MKNNYSEIVKNLIYDKNTYIKNTVDSFLLRLLSMFEYSNLPSNIKSEYIEKNLLLYGHCIFTQFENRFIVLSGNFTDEKNEYYENTKYLVCNPYINLNKEYKIDDECILIQNNVLNKGVLDILEKNAYLLNNCEITIDNILFNSRIPYVISVKDNRSLSSAEEFLKRIENGKNSVIMDNAFLESVNVHDLSNKSNVTSIIELVQFIKSNTFNDIGLSENTNYKREKLNNIEIEIGRYNVIPFIDMMYNTRKKCIENINNKYNLNIEIQLSSTWKKTKELAENTGIEKTGIENNDNN